MFVHPHGQCRKWSVNDMLCKLLRSTNSGNEQSLCSQRAKDFYRILLALCILEKMNIRIYIEILPGVLMTCRQGIHHPTLL